MVMDLCKDCGSPIWEVVGGCAKCFIITKECETTADGTKLYHITLTPRNRSTNGPV
jgi:hypothetical protein